MQRRQPRSTRTEKLCPDTTLFRSISFSPGPSAISAMAVVLKYGFSRGYGTTLGLILGILIQFMIVAVGLGALLAASEMAFSLVKLLGVFYLIYLGWKQFRTDAAPVAVESNDPTHFRARDLIVRGCLINITNPKGTVFLLAVVPQFLDLSRPLRSEEHTSELQSLMRISYAVFCLKKQTPNKENYNTTKIIIQR